MSRAEAHRLSTVITGDEPPDAFPLFQPDEAGLVQTSKGAFVFDTASARSVLEEWERHGANDLPVDWEHASLSADIAPDPSQAGKAAGWFRLEMRGAELWACAVRWTPAAMEALRQKEFRFTSPAFHTDEAGSITALLNCALTNLPATRRLQPLMAASATTDTKEAPMANTHDPAKTIPGAVDADSEKKLRTIGEALGMTEPFDGAAILEAVQALVIPLDDAPSEEGMGDRPEPGSEPAAIRMSLARLTGEGNPAAALAKVEGYKAKIKQLSVKVDGYETADRRDLVARLVRCGAETPHTSGLSRNKMAPHLAGMPLVELRAHVEAHEASRGKYPNVGGAAKRPPVSGGTGEPGARIVSTASGAHSLSAREQQICADTGCDPAIYVELRERLMPNGRGS